MSVKSMLAAALGAGALLAALAGGSAQAAVTLAAGEENCDLYTTGCLFNHGGGGEFDDPALLVAAYNAAHGANPPPEDLPELTYLGKSGEGNIDDYLVKNGNVFTFENLPFDVSFYTIKTGPSQVLLFGLPAPTNSFTATNLRITNDKGKPRDISHVALYSVPTAAIPEPATWAMMILGFGAAGAMLRQRRALVAA